MKRAFLCVLVLAPLITTCLYPADTGQSSSQSKRTPSLPTQPLNPQPVQTPMMPMPLVAPLFVSTGEVSSTVTVVNAAAVSGTADVILLDQQGTQITKETLQLAGHTQKTVAISDLLLKAHSGAWIGSVELMPDSQSARNMSIVAQLSLVDKNPSEPAYLEEEFLMPSTMSSNAFHAASSSILGRPALALKSTSMAPQAVTITCLAERGGSRARTIQLAANEMVLIGGCDTENQPIPAFEEFWHQQDRDAKGSIGLSVTTTGMPGELDVYGFVVRGTNEHPTYTALNFSDTGMLHSSNTVFAGVPIGQTSLIPGDTFKAEIALANFSSSPALATILYATMKDDNPTANTVASVTVSAQSSATIRLPGLPGDPQLRNSFVVQSSVSPGLLAANLTAVGDEVFRTVQLIGKDQQQMQNGGSHPWTLEDSTASTLLLFNPSSSKNRVDVRIAANGELWLRRYQLEALETKAISIGEIVVSGVQGDNGQILPKNATSGEVNWSTEAAGQGIGRLLVSQPASLLARNFSCGNQVQACSSYLNNGYLGISDPGSGSMGPLVVEFCIGATACTGANDYSSNESGSWSSYSTNIATVPIGPSSSGTVTSVNTGSASILSQANFNGCHAASTGTANVCTVGINSVLPYSDQISTTLSGPTGVTGTAYVWEVDGSATNYSVNGQTRGSGTFNDGFQLTSSSATGQYSAVYASWNACSANVVTSSAHNFFNWGNTLHTQYGVIWENTCANSTSTAYIITNLASCFSSGLVTTTLSSQFESQVAINGTGKSNSYGLIKALAATSCAGATANKPAGSTNANTFVEISSVTGSCGSLSSTTVAQYSTSPNPVNCGQQEFLRGYPSSPGTVKTIEDRCPACSNTAGSAHFDNFNPTQGAPSCGLGGTIPTLGYFVTVTDGQLPAQPR